MSNFKNIIMYNSPLEQFTVFNFFNFFTIYNIKLTNLAVNFIFVILVIIFLMYNSSNRIYLSNTKSVIFNMIYKFIQNIFKENVSVATPYFFPYILFIFLVILFSNLIGLVPFSYTVTSSVIFTFFLSISSFVNIIITGLHLHGLNFFNLFLPQGAPIAIAPFLTIIEFISYNARVFSLAIRLFANMMSGHILLKILATASWSLLHIYFPLSLLVIAFPLTVLLIITFLELCIACLQAYVFITLLCIYFNESINLH